MSKHFSGLVQQVLKNNKLEFKYSEYLRFWKNEADSGENLTYFMHEIIRQIIQIEGSTRSAKSAAMSELLCTLLSLYAFKLKNADRKIVSLPDLEQIWKGHEEKITKQGVPKCPFVYPILSTFFKYLVEDEPETEPLQQMIFAQLCMMPLPAANMKPEVAQSSKSKAQVQSALNQKFLKEIYAKLNEHFSRCDGYQKSERLEFEANYHVLYRESCEIFETCEFSYGFEYLYMQLKERKRLPEGGIPDAILKVCLDYLEFLPSVLAKFPQRVEKTAMAVFHMLRQMLTSNPLSFEKASAYLNRMLELIEVFTHMPFPFGYLATEMSELLKAELKTPGTAFRFRIREEVPSLDYLNSEHKKQENSEKSEALLTAYCILDETSERSLLGIFDQNELILKKEDKKTQEKYPENFLTVHEIRSLIVAHIFHLHSLASPDFLKNLLSLEEKDIFFIYCRILNILEKSDELDSLQDIKNIQKYALEELRLEINELVKDMLEVLPRAKAGSEIDKRIDILLSTFQSFLPSMPSYCLTKINKKFSERSKGSIHYKSMITENMLNDDRKSYYLSQNYEDSISDLAKSLMESNLPLHQESFKLVLFGGDAEVGVFVNIIAKLLLNGQLKKEKAKDAASEEKERESATALDLDLRIYLVPNKSNALAKLIAMNDFWYNKFIYIPFAEQPLLPRLQSFNLDNPPEGEDVLAFPNEVNERLIQTYLRDALKIVNVKLSEVDCYSYDHINEKKKTPDFIFYFCECLEIGAGVEFKEITKKKKNVADNFYDAKERGLIKFDFIELEINAVEIGVEGGKSEDQGFFQVNAHTLKVNNIYTDYFEGNLPIPNSDWLELSYIEYENTKIKDRYMKKKTFLKKYTREQIQSAIKSLYVNIPVSEVTIRQPKNEKFQILADGNVYGKYNEISIRVASYENDRHQPQMPSQPQPQPRLLTLPFATFLPVTF